MHRRFTQSVFFGNIIDIFTFSLLDFMNVMTFDFQGSWLSRLEHPSPLYSRSGQAGDEKYKNVVNKYIT